MEVWFPVALAVLGASSGVPLTRAAERMLRGGRRFGWPVQVVVGASTGALVAGVAFVLGPVGELPAYLYLVGIAVVLAVVDIAEKRLPNAIIYPSLVALPALLTAAAWVTNQWPALLGAALGAAALFALYLLLALVAPGGIGLGDVKLAAVIGFPLGYLGWTPVFVGGFSGFLIGSLVSLAAIAARRATLTSSLPFGPSMLAGAFVGVFFS